MLAAYGFHPPRAATNRLLIFRANAAPVIDFLGLMRRPARCRDVAIAGGNGSRGEP